MLAASGPPPRECLDLYPVRSIQIDRRVIRELCRPLSTARQVRFDAVLVFALFGFALLVPALLVCSLLVFGALVFAVLVFAVSRRRLV